MSESNENIAVIGISGRFPQARNVNEFWENIRSGRECITFFTEQDLLNAGVRQQELGLPNYVRANGIVPDYDMFDAGFFGFSPRDAEILDPQQRLFLECAWEVLEDGGYSPETYPGLIGVVAGTTMSTYAYNLYNNPRLAGIVSDFQILTSNDKDHLTTRVAYKFGLRGPAITVGTACSTSLVAISLACQNLLDYQCDMAIAGGVTLGVPQARGYVYEEGGISSPDGHCRPFDSSAKGTVGGNGVAVVLLKRLSEAIADGDAIRAVVRGYGLNNDGSAKVGYTAPSVGGQAEAIAMAMSMANVDPESITLLEAHGTATPLGDPIEFSALKEAYRKARRRQYCALGSVKSNVGHMDSAAGAAGFIKCVLALEHKQIPPSLHFEKPNPKIDIANSPFFVNTKLRAWPVNGIPRRAGLSSFGIGGTNAHVILEEAPPREPSGPSRPFQILGLSARGTTTLDEMSRRLETHLVANPDLPLADIAYTLQAGRKQMSYRRCVIAGADNNEEAGRLLRTRDPRYVFSAVREGKPRSVAFLFPGQGSQSPNMARAVYEYEPVFRNVVDECCELLTPHLGLDLRSLMFPAHGEEQAAADLLQQTRLTQPAVFVISYAYAQLWIRWGIRPSAMIGHSIGEYVAACVAGVFSLPDALQVVALRGRILQEMPAGAMLAVSKAPSEVSAILNDNAEIAAVNGPGLTVVSGDYDRMTELEHELRLSGVAVTRLHTSHAFHSRLMDGAVPLMEQALARVKLAAPEIPFLSNVTGTWIHADDAQSPAYWGRHIRSTVKFADGLAQLFRDADTILLEAGPGTTLTSLARQNPSRAPSQPVLSSARHPLDNASDERVLLTALARLWTEGAAVNWNAFYEGESRQRVHLPTYPFDRQRYWIDAASESQETVTRVPSGRLPLDDWFYVPHWVRDRPAPGGPGETAENWMVFGDGTEVTDALCRRLRTPDQRLICVEAGNEVSETGPDHFTAPPQSLDGLRELFQLLIDRGFHPRRIVHLWNVSRHDAFYSPLRVLQAAVAELDTSPLDVMLVSVSGQRVLPSDVSVPAQAIAFAPLLTVSQEYPHIQCRLVDVDDQTLRSAERAAEDLTREAAQTDTRTIVAYRGHQRWMLTYEQTPIASASDRCYRGAYLITGGLGKIGLLFAEFLSQRGADELVLVGRTSLPARSEWDGILQAGADELPSSSDASVRTRIERIRAMESRGTKVLLESADASNESTMSGIFARTHFAGVIHAAGYTRASAFPSFSALDESHCESQFAPKITATRVLAKLASEHQPQFVCCLSSLAAVLGGLGFTAYAAANQYMDASAWSRHANGATRWVTINWDGWMLEEDPATLERAKNEAVILADEGSEALDRILAAPDLTQVVVSTMELGRRFEQWVTQRRPPRQAAEVTAAVSEGHPRPTISTEFDAPAEGGEMQVAGIWRDLLGLDKVGANDNFFELGGHSLLAIQVISRLREALHRDLPVRILFDHPTVRMLAEALDDQPREAPPDISELIDKVEQMSDDEARALLSRSRSSGAV
jgi:acyl transferase domain-containing protein